MSVVFYDDPFLAKKGGGVGLAVTYQAIIGDCTGMSDVVLDRSLSVLKRGPAYKQISL